MQGRRIILTKPPFDSLIPREHLLRKVDQVLDLSFVYGLTKSYYCANNGRPSIDPILYFKIQFLAYLYNIPSERRICHELKYNLVVPD
jgi:transposase